MDTVLQHARMFGARDKEDMAVTRFHTTPAIYQVFSHMNEIDDQLRETLISGKQRAAMCPLKPYLWDMTRSSNPVHHRRLRLPTPLVLKSHYRLYPRGFQTGRKTKIGRTIYVLTSF